MIRNVGNLSIVKGKKNGVSVSMWDAVPLCDPSCSIFLNCPHNDYENKKEIKKLFLDKEDVTSLCTSLCSLRKRYLNSVYTSIKNGIKKKDVLTEHKIGMFLIPLYSNLVTFKILEYSLRGNSFTTRGGISPIYKEMRETMRLINSLLKEMEMDLESRGSNGRPGYIHGDEDYYDQMMDTGEVVDG
jgi:hypothetical protein